jgi:tRNA-2-methylthio-N6-dimethylallyladenosine synthase
MTQTVTKKSLYMKTYGCQMNVYDSQRMEESLSPLGFHVVDSPDDADLMILNTCHIRAKAEDKLFSDLGRLRAIKEERETENKSTIVVVAGCVGQALGASIIKRAPYVDLVVGPQTYHTLPETITRILWKTEPESISSRLALGFTKMKKFDELPQIKGIKGPTAFLSIQEGCNKFCKYCVVPYTRGPEYSRSVEDILKEARHLVQLGAKEITLLGQNVNAYHGQDAQGKESSLGRLIFAMADISGLQRIRYTTSHPRDVDDDLLAAHRDVPTLMPLLHLPVQSGSNKILAKMNRQYTQEFYLDIIEKFLKANPRTAFSSDFIVGYPEETDEDFQATCHLVSQVKFAQAFSFKYSPRTGTPAAMMPQIDENIKNQRLYTLQSLLTQHRQDFNDQFVGKIIPVLVEHTDKSPRFGRSAYMHAVRFVDTESQIGDTVQIEIQKSLTNSLFGERVG